MQFLIGYFPLQARRGKHGNSAMFARVKEYSYQIFRRRHSYCIIRKYEIYVTICTYLVGVGTKRYFINVSNLYDTLAENLANSLSGSHATTGNDFN